MTMESLASRVKNFVRPATKTGLDVTGQDLVDQYLGIALPSPTKQDFDTFTQFESIVTTPNFFVRGEDLQDILTFAKTQTRLIQSVSDPIELAHEVGTELYKRGRAKQASFCFEIALPLTANSLDFLDDSSLRVNRKAVCATNLLAATRLHIGNLNEQGQTAKVEEWLADKKKPLQTAKRALKRELKRLEQNPSETKTQKRYRLGLEANAREAELLTSRKKDSKDEVLQALNEATLEYLSFPKDQLSFDQQAALNEFTKTKHLTLDQERSSYTHTFQSVDGSKTYKERRYLQVQGLIDFLQQRISSGELPPSSQQSYRKWAAVLQRNSLSYNRAVRRKDPEKWFSNLVSETHQISGDDDFAKTQELLTNRRELIIPKVSRAQKENKPLESKKASLIDHIPTFLFRFGVAVGLTGFAVACATFLKPTEKDSPISFEDPIIVQTLNQVEGNQTLVLPDIYEMPRMPLLPISSAPTKSIAVQKTTMKEAVQSVVETNTQLYFVKKGDTLWDIAEKFYGTPTLALCRKLAEINGIKNADLIFYDPPDVLMIPESLA